MYFAVLKSHPTVKVINHKFLVPGHTHMECDGDHALIERTRRRSETPIHHPRDWYQMENKKFIVSSTSSIDDTEPA
ncbi:unnamed protein product [Acanthoscelides obtectus]|uniref:Uncharacterized protein n=1 Tax=Acanthoscelides obtectus TaxID=200917 RepID=A0A9P0MBM2_ACAOB|nr:unnamed protein product [Acanthoscelides obtectus]CAK1643511.1 hypothetical protein AOBTE_LOCUS13557 [Acanthoscelides obtectus]